MSDKHARKGRRRRSSTRQRAGQAARPHNSRLERAVPPDLVSDVRRAISADHPIDLLALVSSVLAVVDPRGRSPFAPDDQPEFSRAELLQSFLDMPSPETSALLAVIAEMTEEDLLRARILKELASRPSVLQRWLAGLSEVVVYRTVEIVHVLGDGDNIMLGARLPDGHELTCVVYIDHNLGSLVKDAFVVPEALAEVIALMRSNADVDTSWRELDPAAARARVRAAIDVAAMTVPPFETETWPACRALVEWLNALLPEGGTGYQRPEWDSTMLTALSEQFFASAHGAELDDHEHRTLLDSVLWFGTDYGPGDPLRWSPVSVEILLVDWVPRKVVADPTYLAKAPRLLRAFIRFCHAERGIRASLTTETLLAVDHWEPEYQRIIRSPRPQGPAALLAAPGAIDPDEDWSLDDDELDTVEEIMLDVLRRAVGGADQLDKLDELPLPDENIEWEAIPDDIRDRVSEVLTLLDRCCDELLNQEYRTSCRRLLARAATGDPEVFRRRGRVDTAAAAIAWISGGANDLFRSYGQAPRMLVKDLMGHFGLKQSSISSRAKTILRAGGFDADQYGSIELGSPDYLTSARRRDIIELRDRYRAAIDG
ncbi:MAG: DUF6398 domain-containing protein [Haloechinothrix sp.]